MFEVTEKASEMIKKFLAGQPESHPIRILKTEGGWKGPYLVLAMDEQKETDQVFTEKGITFIIEKELLDRSKPISIDYVESTLGSGYRIKSDLMKGSIFECDCIREHC